MVIPFLPLYLTQNQSFTIEQAATIFTAYGVGSLIASPLVGLACDRWGSSIPMIFSLLFSAVVLFFFPYFAQLIHNSNLITDKLLCFWILVFILSVGTESFRPASLVATGEYLEGQSERRRRFGFSLIRLAVNIGFSIGPALGGAVVFKLGAAGYEYLFRMNAAAIGLSGLTLIVFFLKGWITSIPKHTAPHMQQYRYGWLSKLRTLKLDRNFLIFCLVFIPISMVFFQQESTLTLFVNHDLRLNEAIFGSIFSLNAALIIFFEIPLNLYLSKHEAKNVMASGAVLVGLGFGCLAFTTSIVGLMISTIFWTFGEMILFPIATAYVDRIAPKSKRGIYMGLFSTIFSVGLIAGPWIGLNLYHAKGSTVLWVLTFFASLLSAIGFFALKVKTTLRNF